MKDRFLSALGFGGVILYYCLTSLMMFAPLIFLQWPFWADFLIIAAVLFLPIIGSIVQFVMWGLSVPAVLAGPFDIFTILYCCALAAYILVYLLPAIMQIISALLSRRE